MTHLTRALAALAVTGAAAAAAVPAQAQDTQTCGIYVFFNSGQSSVGASARDVLIEFARILRFYLDCGIRVFRLDAVAFLWKEEEKGRRF